MAEDYSRTLGGAEEGREERGWMGWRGVRGVSYKINSFVDF